MLKIVQIGTICEDNLLPCTLQFFNSLPFNQLYILMQFISIWVLLSNESPSSFSFAKNEFYVLVVSMGHFPAFYVVLVPLEYYQ